MVFDRDGWECQLCFRNIDPAAVMPDWGSATVDHVIPVAFGGRDDPGNLRAAHFHCNAQRQTGEFDISRAASPDRLVAGAQRIDKLRERDSRIIDDVLRGDLTVREIAARYGFADYGSVAMVLRRRGVAVNAQARRWRVERSRAAL